MSLLFKLILITIIVKVLAKNEAYIGNKLYKVKFVSEKQQDKLGQLKNDNIDFWRNPSFKYGVEGLAMVAQADIEWFEKRLEDLEIEKDIVVQDVYEFLNKNQESLVKTGSNENRQFNFESYHRYDDIVEHVRSLEATYNDTIEVVTHSNTVENRPLLYVKISTTNFEVNKPIIVIEAGMTPREWITIPAAINVIQQLHETVNANFLQNADFIIVPTANPDGYEYTHTGERLWTKNRSLRTNLGFVCPGVNINRNFDIAWNSAGSSSSPCSGIFAGLEPFSEEESSMIKSIYDENANNIRLYMSLHNEGSFLSYPWHYERAASGRFRHHHLLGIEVIEAMGIDSNYNVDIGSVALGDRASGTSDDYMHANNVLFAFTVGIPQAGVNGFDIPEESISSSIEPVWRAVAAASNYVLNTIN